jgi:YtxH-like protein
MNQFLRLLFGLGLALTEPRQRRRVYDRVTDKLEDVTEQASRGYEAAADRVERLYKAARGEDHRALAGATSFLIGVGVGVGAGILFAPASGRQTRDAIAEKVERFRGDVRESMRHGEERKTA